MENADKPGVAGDWRQAWRAFADQMSGRPDNSRDEVPAALGAKRKEAGGRSFQGFGSPPGKF